MPTFHLLIKGKVQGVFFRATAKEVAEKLSLKGWIKNTEDDSVEAVVTGPLESLKNFTDWCRKGPQRAEVTDVEVREINEESFEKFTVIR